MPDLSPLPHDAPPAEPALILPPVDRGQRLSGRTTPAVATVPLAGDWLGNRPEPQYREEPPMPELVVEQDQS